jgi:uncharacterized membrane protein YdjX (TVP38/TMEM64 family)
MKVLRITLGAIITLAILVVLYLLAKDLISNVSSITALTKSAGMFGPILLILLIGLGIIFTPIPNVVLTLAAGYLYGTWLGALYSYLGHMLAAVGTFAIIRIFKIERESKSYKKYKKLIEKNKKLLYLLYAAPVIPISVLSAIASSSKMKWKEFLKIINISFIPVILFFSYFGERISQKHLIEIGIFILIIIVGVFIVLRMTNRRNKKMNEEEEKVRGADLNNKTN